MIPVRAEIHSFYNSISVSIPWMDAVLLVTLVIITTTGYNHTVSLPVWVEAIVIN